MIVKNSFVRFLVIRVLIHQFLVQNVFSEFEKNFLSHINSIDRSLLKISSTTNLTKFVDNFIIDSSEHNNLKSNSTEPSAVSTYFRQPKIRKSVLRVFSRHKISKRQAPTGAIGLGIAIAALVVALSVVVVLFIVSMAAAGILGQVLRILRRALTVLFLSFQDVFPVLPFVLFKHKDIKLGILQSFHHFDQYLLSKCVNIREYPTFFKLYTKFYKILTDKLLNYNKLKCLGPKCVTKIIGTLNAKLYSMKAEIVILEREINKLVPYKNDYTMPFMNMPHKPVEDYKISKMLPKHFKPYKKLIPPNIAQCLVDNSKKQFYYDDYYL